MIETAIGIKSSIPPDHSGDVLALIICAALALALFRFVWITFRY